MTINIKNVCYVIAVTYQEDCKNRILLVVTLTYILFAVDQPTRATLVQGTSRHPS
jgi:hypothetical protein